MGLAELAGLDVSGTVKIGYARVSTDDQNLALQIDALNAAGCARIYADDGVSGIAVSRPALNDALAALRPGDTLVIWRLDRLGRSLAHLIEVVEDLRRRGVEFRSLSDAIDTSNAGGRLYFHILGALAEFERCLISERTRAGMAAAKARGRPIGRPLKLSPSQILEAKAILASGGASLAELAELYDVSPLTLSRTLKKASTH